MRRLAVFPILAALIPGLGNCGAVEPAVPAALCDGLPRLPAKTAPGFCLGLVVDGLKAPRAVQPLTNGDVVVAEMGSWQAGRGRIWVLRQAAGRYEKKLLFDHLDRPSALALAPDGSVFVGMVKRVARFDALAGKPVLVDVIGGASGIAALPGVGRHLLPSLLFDAHGDLYVSVGSGSDHCEGADGQMPAAGRCPEREGEEALGVIRRYSLKWPGPIVQRWEVYAKGLRNSMAMAFEPRSGVLWQGENGRDGINVAMPALKNDDDLPHDELNAIERGADYGWPFCYDSNRPSPEYPSADCSRFRAPRRLLPAHAAPLGMTFYTGGTYPARFNGSLFITYHGYRQQGHRIVALLPDGRGAPLGRSMELVTGTRHGARRFGAPVGIRLGPDGRVYLTDDHDGIVARLSYESGK